jgi:hypothetical protein
MAKVEVKTEETRCDRCDKRIAKERERVTLTSSGVETNVNPSPSFVEIDLCKACEESLSKWWARGKAGEE